MTTTNPQGRDAMTGTTKDLPPLPEWSKRDDLGGLVPSEIRAALHDYARAALAQAAPKVCRMLTDEEYLGALVDSYNSREEKTPREIIQRKFATVNNLPIAARGEPS